MKKLTIAVLGILGAFALKADDSYLYWTISDNAAAEIGAESLAGYTAKIWSTQDSSYLNLYSVPDSSMSVFAVDAIGAQLAGVAASIGNSPSGSFFVELWNDGGLQGRSDTYTYQTLAQYIGTTKFTSNLPKDAFALVGGFKAVPEPSSGLMLLMGLSALALRRKKRA